MYPLFAKFLDFKFNLLISLLSTRFRFLNCYNRSIQHFLPKITLGFYSNFFIILFDFRANNFSILKSLFKIFLNFKTLCLYFLLFSKVNSQYFKAFKVSRCSNRKNFIQDEDFIFIIFVVL